MFDLYREAKQDLRQQRRDAWQGFWIVMRAEPWRLVILPGSMVLTLFLTWALSHDNLSPGFKWLVALITGSLLIGTAWLSAYVRARWASRQPSEQDQ